MLEFKLTGEEELQKFFNGLPQRLQREAALQSLVRSAQPVVNRMKTEAPLGETGALRQSIGFRFRSYRNGKFLYVAIGPRRGVWGKGKNKPTHYAHLVEFGFVVGKDRRLRIGRRRFGKDKRREVKPNAFMRRTWLAMKQFTLDNFRREFAGRLKVEVNRRRSRKTKKS